MKSAKKEPRGERPGEAMHKRGHFESHGKGEELSHTEFNKLDHGGAQDHMIGRDDQDDE